MYHCTDDNDSDAVLTVVVSRDAEYEMWVSFSGMHFPGHDCVYLSMSEYAARLSDAIRSCIVAANEQIASEENERRENDYAERIADHRAAMPEGFILPTHSVMIEGDYRQVNAIPDAISWYPWDQSPVRELYRGAWMVYVTAIDDTSAIEMAESVLSDHLAMIEKGN